MNRYEMVVGIIFIVMVASVLRAWIRAGRRGPVEGEVPATLTDAETVRLRDEVKQLRERIQVLERITVEKENSLERQIEELRDR